MSKNRCINGHEFTTANTMIRNNYRACRTCYNRRQRKYGRIAKQTIY